MASTEVEIQDAQQRFNENFAAISAAKEQVGDWEKAYRLVTGKDWPKDQNVKIQNGQGMAVKDLPWWKDALKFAGPVAGVAAAPFTGGLSAALIGAGAGAAGSAIRGDGLGSALKSAALGAGSGYAADKLFGAMGGGGAAGDVASAATGGGWGDALKKIAGAGIPVGAAVAGRAMGGGNGSGGNAAMPPELQQLLTMAMQRMSQQEPLFQSINAQAMAGLPTAYQR